MLYQCENCYSTHYQSKYIYECYHCGEDCCVSCRRETDNYFYCSDCYDLLSGHSK